MSTPTRSDATPLADAVYRSALPLSWAQRDVWTRRSGSPDAQSTITTAARFNGELDVRALQFALGEIVRRHAALRTTFVDGTNGDGSVRQRVVEDASEPFLVPLTELGASDWESEAGRLIADDSRRPFNLAGAPRIRARLLRSASDEHVLVLTACRLAVDRRSMDVLQHELAALYEALAKNESPAAAAASLSSARHRAADNSSPAGQVDSHLAWWSAQFEGASAVELPKGFASPSAEAGARGRHSLPLPEEVPFGGEPAGGGPSDLFVASLAATAALLQRYTASDDVSLMTELASDLPESRGLVGCIGQTLPLRINLSNDPTTADLLARVRRGVADAQAHHGVPFDRLLQATRWRESGAGRGGSVLVNVRPLDDARPAPSLVMSRLPTADPDRDAHDLIVEIDRADGAWRVTLDYDAGRFDEAFASQMARHWRTLLTHIVSRPDQPLAGLSLLTDEERHTILDTWNKTWRGYSDLCAHQLFEAQVARTPSRVAVMCADRQLTFRELNERANRLATRLRTLGVQPETVVALQLPRSIEAIVAVLGVLKAGGGYLALDRQAPPQRLAEIIEDAQPLVILTMRRELDGRLPGVSVPLEFLDSLASEDESSAENLTSVCTPDNLAYVSYTAGSSGTPKGVIATHRSITNGLNAIPFRIDDEQEVCGLQTSLSFGASVAQLFLPLMCGVPIRIIADEDARDAVRLAQAIETFRVTVVSVVTPLLRQMLSLGPPVTNRLKRLRLVIVGGAMLTRDLVEAFEAVLPYTTLHEGYGASEAGGAVMVSDRGSKIGAHGRAFTTRFPNTRLYILDRTLSPLPPGIEGEIYIGGDHLSRGYLRRPDLTAERFVRDPFTTRAGARLYRTGDVGRYLADGSVELLGRGDDQVKVRGHRISLTEVESLLLTHERVREAAAWVHPLDGEPRLVAYIVAEGTSPTVTELREYLRSRLPDYMLPSAFVAQDRLPLTSAGKVDRRALPPPEPQRPALAVRYVPPRHSVDLALTQMWADLLGLNRVGIHDDFLELGGDSLIAMQVVARIWEQFGTEVPFEALFERATVAELADAFLGDLIVEGRGAPGDAVGAP